MVRAIGNIKYRPSNAQRRLDLAGRLDLNVLAKLARQNAWPNDQSVTTAVAQKIVAKCVAGISDKELAFVFTSFSELVLRPVINDPALPRSVCLRLAVLGSRYAFTKIDEVDTNNIPYSDLVRLSDSRHPEIRSRVDCFRGTVIECVRELLREAQGQAGSANADLVFFTRELRQSHLPEQYAILYEAKRLDPIFFKRLPSHLQEMTDPFYDQSL